MGDQETNVIEQIRALVAQRDRAPLRDALAKLHPADIAEVLPELDSSQQTTVLTELGTDKAAEVLTEVDEHSGQALLQLLSDAEVVKLLEEMPSDDAVDLIAQMPPEKSAQIDRLLPIDEREKLRELMEFDEDTAGGIMEVEKVAVSNHATIRDAIELVRKLADDMENLQNVYVVDSASRLIGSIPILDLLLHDGGKLVTEVMDENPISVPVAMDQEDVAALFGKYDEFILPVLDEDGKLVGRITVDDIIDVLEEEASEDIARIAGTVEDELGETSPLKVSRARLPWLIIAMLGQVLNAVIMSAYKVPLETYAPLVFFIPLVIGTAGSTGVQSAVVVVREIAIGEVNVSQVGRRVFRELQVTLLNGSVLGIILFVIVSLWQREYSLALMMWVSLFAVTLVSAFLGASIPLLMERKNIDPAIASGPFITVVSDILGLLIYLTIVTFYVSRYLPE